MTTLLLGSISTLVDTSELQRRAFNDAFEAHGLDWHWDRDRYRELLTSNGGQQRIADVADERGEDVDAAAVHATKTQRFHELLAEDAAGPRPGVRSTIAQARERGVQVGVVTTTSADNVDAVLSVVGFDRDELDLVLDRSDVERGKPDPEVYRLALERLGASVGGTVAVEDNVGGVEAATGAGLPCVAFPNANTADHDLGAEAEVDELRLDDLLARIAADGER